MVLLLFAAGCGNRDSSAPDPGDGPAEARFTIEPEHLDEPYENARLGTSFRPPAGWRPLDAEQRDRIATALLAVQDDGRYRLDLVDLFLRTETMSFAAVSRITQGGDPVRNAARYVEDFLELLGPEDEDQLRARSDFAVNGIPVTQIRHLQSGRVSFTLVFPATDGTLLQLNYSIPPPAYEEEGAKLESSVGTIRHIGEDG